jgi:hypothetical protein
MYPSRHMQARTHFELTGPAGKMVYDRSDLGDWYDGNGSRFLFEDLAWSLANCGGIVRVIVAVRDRRASPHVRMAECYPQKNLFMRITHLDPEKRAFRLEQVTPTHSVTSLREQSTAVHVLEPFTGR